MLGDPARCAAVADCLPSANPLPCAIGAFRSTEKQEEHGSGYPMISTAPPGSQITDAHHYTITHQSLTRWQRSAPFNWRCHCWPSLSHNRVDLQPLGIPRQHREQQFSLVAGEGMEKLWKTNGKPIIMSLWASLIRWFKQLAISLTFPSAFDCRN